MLQYKGGNNDHLGDLIDVRLAMRIHNLGVRFRAGPIQKTLKLQTSGRNLIPIRAKYIV